MVEHGNIDLHTVYPTRRGAIINWLVTHGQPILAVTTDSEVERVMGNAFSGARRIVVHKVLVSVEQ